MSAPRPLLASTPPPSLPTPTFSLAQISARLPLHLPTAPTRLASSPIRHCQFASIHHLPDSPAVSGPITIATPLGIYVDDGENVTTVDSNASVVVVVRSSTAVQSAAPYAGPLTSRTFTTRAPGKSRSEGTY
uniref:Uncharacterized protein n=1 Tax=Oryza barthii TaxID=65489 RepID=A0A0D3FS51_9ORYZ